MKPEKITLDSFGDFHLWQKTLNGHEFFYYTGEITTTNKVVKVVLHPPKGTLDWDEFIRSAPALIASINGRHREIILSRWFPIWNLLRRYGDWSITPRNHRKLAEKLHLQTIKIIADEDHEIILKGVPTHSFLDLFVSFDEAF
ncbi:hypothetical protein N9B73_03330 [Verrucomicrobiales bacterium]|nr:hypothetical protein [Verrucomicrobiales bacterium]